MIGDIPHVWNTPVLQNFCGDNEIVLVHAYENKENLEKIAVKLAVGKAESILIFKRT